MQRAQRHGVLSTKAALESACSGSRTAAGEVIARVDSVIIAIIRRYLGPRCGSGDEEDLRQEIRLAVNHGLRNVRQRDRASLIAWIKKVARSRIIDWERQRRARRRAPGVALLRMDTTNAPEIPARRENTPSQELMRAEERDLVERALELVKPRYRPLLELIYRRAPSAAELAEFLGKEPEAARKHAARALSELKRAIHRLRS
jgi:RNA polymerase sigma factor (sigma-70 family)